MSKKILVSYDFNKNKIQNARLQNLATAPASPVVGQAYYDTGLGSAQVWNGSAWVPTDAAKVANGAIPLAKLAADPLARANHGGTQAAATISDLASTVKAYKLNEFGAPVAAVGMNAQKISGLADPTLAQDAATMNFVLAAVQSAAAGIDAKVSCRAVAVGAITLSAPQTIDGIAVVAGDRILVKGQAAAATNGVYVVAAGAWGRAPDSDLSSELTPGAFWYIEEGTAYGKSQWRIENTGAIVLGTTNISINQFGAAQVFVAGNGLTLSGNTFDLVAGNGLTVAADSVSIDTAVVVRKVSATVGDGVATSITVTHNLNNQDVQVQVREVSTNLRVECDVQNNGVNTVVLSFAVAPASGALRAVIQG